VVHRAPCQANQHSSEVNGVQTQTQMGWISETSPHGFPGRIDEAYRLRIDLSGLPLIH
jgi:hypothetical protein